MQTFYNQRCSSREIQSKHLYDNYCCSFLLIPGSLFAVLCALQAILRVVGNLVFNTIYGQTQNILQGFSFLVEAGFEAIGLAFAV